jgi:ABC-type uncharacterized transport system fused permease/ATPase subunit
MSLIWFRICLLDECWQKGKWKIPVILILSLMLYELAAIQIMTVLSQLYASVSAQDQGLFWSTLSYSLVVVTLTSLFKSLCSFFADSCALQWRCTIVDFLQRRYVLKSSLHSTAVLNMDGIDQRITQDVDLFTSKCASLLSQVALLPFVIVYYSLYLTLSFGWITLLICFSYFGVGCLMGSLLAGRLVRLTYLQEFFEGRPSLLYVDALSRLMMSATCSSLVMTKPMTCIIMLF